MLRTNLDKEQAGTTETIRHYKSLAQVERAFRHLKSALDIRPIFHFRSDWIRAHVFLCMLAYLVEWEMRRRLKPLLFTDESPLLPEDPVLPHKPSESALAKTGTRKSTSGHPLQSFRTLLAQLATLTRNTVRAQWEAAANAPFHMLSKITPFQEKAFRLLAVTP